MERNAQISSDALDGLLGSHIIDPVELRADDFDAFFNDRRERLCLLIESATGKAVQRDISSGALGEDSSHFEDDPVESSEDA